MEKTKITFKQESDTYVSILRDGKQIGHVYSQREDKYEVGEECGGFPYPHNNSEYCKNSIQICGFDNISEVWGCGPFHGKKDVVVHFLPLDDSYYKEKQKKYENYLNNKINKGEFTSIQNFADWNKHNI